jgi:hypothetical protein
MRRGLSRISLQGIRGSRGFKEQSNIVSATTAPLPANQAAMLAEVSRVFVISSSVMVMGNRRGWMFLTCLS